jgi:hypothetical protein
MTEPALKARNIITVGEAHGNYATTHSRALKGRYMAGMIVHNQ